ncbi:hypothetical protein MKW98_014977 [Papaver atlanticum]|uniref:F-box domain-containing protein n=1 Tax=Papaver atlanticum TaxID=357466 RepID=A0AAD4XHH7_9MAGN|nr:hypothetical protein MKW98_014977 [Papaver atlanticum]
MEQQSRSGDFSIVLVGEIVCEILSRLPVKTLMRFKCVCKGWLSFIEDDSYFIDLHLAQSKLRPCFTLTIPRKLDRPYSPGTCNLLNRPHKADILIADLSETGRIVPPILGNVRQTISLNYDGVLKPVNGLVCFTSTFTDIGVCIYNLSTRELSPWIRTTFPIKKRRFIDYFPSFKFGFDPATKEHKVICIWDYEENDSFQYQGSLVMTVGANTWRTIDEVPQYYLKGDTAVYANGSVHWITYALFHKYLSERKLLIVAFDVGSEKFRIITVPKFITDQFGEDFDDVTHLLEVNDRVALAHILPDGNIAKLWILHDNTNWKAVTLKLPFLWDENQWVEFHGIAGTDQILLETYADGADMKHVSLYSYNWKNKAFRKMKTGVLYSSIRSLTALSEDFKNYESLCETFTESLLRVPKKYALRE